MELDWYPIAVAAGGVLTGVLSHRFPVVGPLVGRLLDAILGAAKKPPAPPAEKR